MINKVLVITLLVVFWGCKKKEVDSSDLQSTPQDSSIEAIRVSDSITIPEPELPVQMVKKRELTTRDLYSDYDGGSQLKDFFVIELIDRETFVDNKTNAVSFVVGDSTSYPKVSGVIQLPAKNARGFISFVDDLSGSDDHAEYTYYGDVPDLNVYLIYGIYWEDWDFFFADKIRGTVVQSFNNYPYLSPDQKNIVCLDIDLSEGVASVDLFSVTDKKYVDPIISMYIKSWVPVDAIDKIYWAKDGFLYIPVVHAKNYWDADGYYKDLDQYIRLKPIA